jgi:hypothetical protein
MVNFVWYITGGVNMFFFEESMKILGYDNVDV